ncbi:hypothetical protein C453_10555 [Haloferax elongans ATCC BAA-1513]|uniref:DUF2267 domain-containing protein n=1 Tax=Haloferax elongans ATCC BAA-1513 TaxID=1230453 RepID=M0HKF3_HALEO|nr:DUF2267 domain-containing protein [Haloferax elongans]ELZ85015.1 hypothetical protein C453_10555 [Haloferax elongans ATCC BAA-1513]
MDFGEFTGQVTHRLELPGTGKSVRAIRATLMTLGQRIQKDEAKDLASSLPMEIDWYLTGAVREHGERFDWHEFIDRVSEIEGIDRSKAAYHARVIIDLVASIVPESEIQQVRNQLPEGDDGENWDQLFSLVDSGGWGDAQEAQTGGGPQPTDESGGDASA